MVEGFIPFARSTWMIDFVACAMAGVVILLSCSLLLVRLRRTYLLHRSLQLVLAIVLVVIVLGFEVDIRLNGWRHLAEVSPFYNSLVFPVLFLHIAIALSTIILWSWTICLGLKNFANPPRPGPHSARHRLLGRWSAAGMYLTAFSGWVFYYLAFVAI